MRPTTTPPARPDDDPDFAGEVGAPAHAQALVDRLPLCAVRLQVVSDTGWHLPQLPAAVVRGAFGAALHSLSCSRNGCPPCGQPSACAYGLLFESPRGDAVKRLGAHDQIPHPISLRARVDDAGRRLIVRLDLFGETASSHIGRLVQALLVAVERGLGSHRQSGQLQGVECLTGDAHRWIPATSPPTPCPLAIPTLPGDGRATIQLETPLRLQRQGHVLKAKDIDAEQLLRAMLHRASLLVAYHGTPGSEPDYGMLNAKVRQMWIEEASLEWTEHQRWSARQGSTVPLGGVTGTLTLGGPSLPDVWPLICLAERTGIGKGTIQGLGSIRVTGCALNHCV